MGEYFVLNNKTKKQRIHPHHVGSGAKFGEWVYPGSNVMLCALDLYARGAWDLDDEIRIASDYERSFFLRGAFDSGPGEQSEEYFDESYSDVHFEVVEDKWSRAPVLSGKKLSPEILDEQIARVQKEPRP